MKIAITGHTRGFGEYLYNYYCHANDVMGFSRSNGFNISLKSDREKILSQSIDCDLFINCAQEAFYQTEILYDFFHAWRAKKKMILNIGSNARDFVTTDKIYDYAVQKQALNSASKQLGRLDTCRVTTVDFGYLLRAEGSVIGYPEALAYIDFAISSLGKNHRLLEVLVAHE